MGLLTVQRANKLRFYARSALERALIPDAFYRVRLGKKLARLSAYDAEAMLDRVGYYNQLDRPFSLSDSAVALKELTGDVASAYFYDYRALMRYFPVEVRADVEFGDISFNQPHPTLVKSRPIGSGNENNILLKLNSVRHFIPIHDPVDYAEKKDMLVWRGAAWKKWRKDFLKQYWNHPLCDVGQVNPPSETAPAEWVKPKMSIAEQLQYKFILSIEGNDVATNLKWIAQSNSLCFMTRPKFETWMMEGRLTGGEHYVELRDDYADLPEKVEHYTAHPQEAREIIRNLQHYYRLFTDHRADELISLMVVKKYLELSGQALRGGQ
ncbi:glycosyl transferase family 90 [Pontiella agarivorans]|uniref:Glycosyl transferase family 90 n=1 Tax=Pontiella agarivorans TaxID=3038953 RepID=A0ABU5N1U3_9BACT|nr:glycosyl transferase family 90 [Pontiella agarivorans]MDZ8120410.1 glycosyl transferase family 90 [Pontiella agarivorans]